MHIRGLVSNLTALALLACGGAGVRRPGVQGDGSILLPNSWSLTPAGTQMAVGDLPLAMALSPDGQYVAITNNGYGDQYVSVIDVARREEVARIELERSWLGVTFGPEGDRLYVSAGGAGTVEVYAFARGKAQHLGSLSLRAPRDTTPAFTAGVVVTPDGRRLLAAALRQSRIAIFDLAHPDQRRFVDVGPFPYAIVTDVGGRTAFVSNWGGQSVSMVDINTGREIARIPVGSHPNAMRLSPDGSRLYVTNANSNDVSIVDVQRRAVVETIDLAPYPNAPTGTTPNGLALSSDGGTLYVVNADNNDVAVVDVSRRPATVRGLIPTGWYPTAVALDRAGHQLLVANGKGLGSKPNPRGPQPDVNYPRTTGELQYIARLFTGTVSFVPLPDERALARYTDQVSANNGFAARRRAGTDAGAAPQVAPRAIPRHVGEPSLITHVFYIIKENRTYDQVLGDLPRGEGDSTLTLFGRTVTPNHHALAETFVLFDNFYVDAEVSADGHEWSTGAIATDFVEKLWPTSYSGRGFPYPSEGEYEIAYPNAGYLWDMASRAGVPYRSYGEFARWGPGHTLPARAAVATLEGHVAPDYPPWDLGVPDQRRADAFITDFDSLVAAGAVPALNVIRLGGDHTSGTRPGAPTPSSMVADNDLALGRIVAAIAASPVWHESAVFVLEDDAQNGPDHIDAHRSVALIASPYAKRGYVDHTMYDTAALLHTIELILGLPPMSQYDAAAVPMVLAFQDSLDPAPYAARPNTFPLDSLNTAQSWGARLSMRMNFAELDAAPEDVLNEIIWKSVKGPTSVMPPPRTVRKRPARGDDDDEPRTTPGGGVR